MPALITRPDAGPAAASPRTAIGVLLITFGVQALLKAVLGFELTLWILVLGGFVLQRWFVDRSFGALTLGGLMVGVGLGAVAKDIVPGGVDGFLGFAGWAFGFMLIAALGGRRASWAYIGAAFSSLFALGSLGIAIGRLVPHAAASITVPLFVVVAGLLLLSPGARRGKVLLVLLGAGFLLFSSSVSDSYREVRQGVRPLHRATVVLPDLDGRTLVIDTGGSVKISNGGSEGSGVALVRGSRRTLRGEVDDDDVKLDFDDVASYELSVPAGTRVEVETENGSIELYGEYAGIDASTENGRIAAELSFAEADPSVELSSDNGLVSVVYDGDPAIDAESDNGEVYVYRGRNTPADNQGDDFERDGDDGELTVQTENGRIDLIADTPARATLR